MKPPGCAAVTARGRGGRAFPLTAPVCRAPRSPDAIMDVDQVGVPYAVAMSLTVQERVTPNNIHEMHKRVMNGPFDILGAESVITSDGAVIQLEFCQDRQSIRLQYGWIIERWLKNDDVVIFNRQPSLHKMSMMGHRVRLVKGSTFRLNLCCANPYNADFDGDEMNMHVVQSPCAAAEVRALMAVPLQICSPQANKPIMSIVQDALLGACLMSQKHALLDRRAAFQLLAWIKYPCKPLKLPPPAVRRPVQRWTGLQILSLLLPPTMTLRRGDAPLAGHELPAGDTALLISQGIFLYATLGKATLGTASNGIIDVMFRDYGPDVTVRFMGDIQRVVNNWLIGRGFAVSISDCVLCEAGQAQVREHVQRAVQNVTMILEENMPEAMAAVCEGTVMRILGRLLSQTGEVVRKHMPSNNAITTMVGAGSKGNMINISQICGCVGQQSVEGKRIHAESAPRTLSCFDAHSKIIHSNGFCSNSYALGLQPTEYFFHMMGGREGLVDTAVKTATTGYIQRRQMKAMEDNRVHYDNTVRNAQNMVLEFAYGGDGFDPTRVEKLEFAPLTMSRDALRAIMCDAVAPSDTQLIEFRTVRDMLRAIRAGRDTPLRPLSATTLLPFNAKRMLKRVEVEVAERADAPEPVASERAIADMASELLQTLRDPRCQRLCLEAAIRFYFCTRTLRRIGCSESQARRLFDALLLKCETCFVAPGESVGAIAAQSIGEPCTQSMRRTALTRCHHGHYEPASHDVTALTLTPLCPFLCARAVTLNVRQRPRYPHERPRSHFSGSTCPAPPAQIPPLPAPVFRRPSTWPAWGRRTSPLASRASKRSSTSRATSERRVRRSVWCRRSRASRRSASSLRPPWCAPSSPRS